MSDAPPEALKRFIWDIQSMVELADDPREILLIGGDILGRLLTQQNWLPAAFAQAGEDGPKRYQIYADGIERFSIVSTVLAPGQSTAPAFEPFWRLFGVVEGVATLRQFEPEAPRLVAEQDLAAGMRKSFKAGGLFSLVNGKGSAPTIILSVHGGEIGKVDRLWFDAQGQACHGATGYDNAVAAPPFDIFTIQTRIVD